MLKQRLRKNSLFCINIGEGRMESEDMVKVEIKGHFEEKFKQFN